MRIIGGILGGKRILAPKNLPVRPTTDFAKEGLFNILNNLIDFDDCMVLDLFSGTGNIALEFASRGAKKVTAIDMHSPCLNFIRDTAKALKINSIFIERADVFKYLEKAHNSYDIIFADPPYELENIGSIFGLVFKNNLLHDDGLLIIEHSSKTNLSDKAYFLYTRKYGNVHFSFFKNKMD